MMPKLNILTLSWQGKNKLEKLAPSLISALEGLDWHWFIQERASSDQSAEYLHSLDNPRIIVCRYQDNRQNFSEGCNYLFNIASPTDSDYVMLLNNDVVFNDTISINNMLNIMQSDHEVGMVGARLLYTGTNKLQHSGVVYVPKYNTPMHYRAGQENDIHSMKDREFQGITGAVCITKSEYYQNIFTNKDGNKGLCQELFWAFDDSDGCLAIKYNMGKKIVYCGATNISHEESASLKKNPINKLFLSHNLSYFLNKWRGRYEIDFEAYTKDKNKGLYEAPKVKS